MFCLFCQYEESDLEADFPSEETLRKHYEASHHIPMPREGESIQECLNRFSAENPEAGSRTCRCPICRHQRGDLDPETLQIMDHAHHGYLGTLVRKRF